MSQTQISKDRTLTYFLDESDFTVFVLIFAGVIGFNVFKGVMTSRV